MKKQIFTLTLALVMCLTFIPVTSLAAGSGSISLDKAIYKPGEGIIVTYSGITQQMVEAEAYISVYKKGAAHNAYGAYEYAKAGDSVIQLEAPNENGEFEMRLYSINHNYSDESFVVSVPFTLSGAVVQQEPPQQVSVWAKTEIDKAAEYGLIPDSLKSADLTKPITREEFAELGVRLYEQSTGTSATAFSPKVLINREQCAAMLFRTINAIQPGGDYSIAGIPDFPDQKSISAYAVPATKYMSKLGIVKGDAKGYFMPKAATTAQTAAAYGMATREAAILMSIRTYDKMDEIKGEI